jgi:hypothetical protein
MMGDDPYLLLASLYATAREAISVARRADLPIAFIDAEGPALVVWASLIAEARKRDKLADIATVVRSDYPTIEVDKAFRALEPSQG